MAQTKRYYWLKLKDDFFNQKEIKKLRKIAGGDTYTVIYLKLLLMSLKNDGVLFFEGVEENFCSEMALAIDEDEENVKFTIMFLQKYKLIEEITDTSFLLPKAVESIGSETSIAARVRRHRQKIKALQCNANETSCNANETNCNVEIDIDIEIEKDIDIDIDNISSCPKTKFSDEHMQLAELLLSLIRQNNPSYRMVGSIEKWANEVRLMVERDKRTLEQIRQIIEWSQQDSFWKTNILSMSKLRKQFDQLTMHKKRGEQYGKPISQANTPRLKTEAEKYAEYN